MVESHERYNISKGPRTHSGPKVERRGIRVRGSPPFLRHVGRLSRRARTSGAVDRTRYGSVRMSPKSYFVHHTQQLSKAAVVGEGASIRRRIDVLKQKACKAIAADAAASEGYTA